MLFTNSYQIYHFKQQQYGNAINVDDYKWSPQHNTTSHINDCEFTGMCVEMFYQYCTLKYDRCGLLFV